MPCFLKNKRLLSVFIPLFVFSLFSSFQEPAYASLNQASFTLEQAIKTTLDSNPKFNSAKLNKFVADEQLQQSKSSYYPSLELQLDAGYDATDTPVINNKEFYKRQMSLTMTQLLFDGDGTTHSVKEKKARVEAAEYQRAETADLIALEVTNSFLDILRQEKLLEIAQSNTEEHENVLKKIRDGEKHGKFNKGDIAQAVSRLARARISLETIIKSLTEAKSSYQEVVGTPPPQNMAIPIFNEALLPDNVEELVVQAKKTSPVLASFRANMDAANADYKSVASGYFPTLHLQLSGTRGEDLGGITGGETLGSAMLSMKWNLFRGGADKSRVKEAFHEKGIAQYNEINTQRQLESDIHSIWAARQTAIKNLHEFEKQLAANEKVKEAYIDQFELNRRSLLDLLNTENEIFVSKSNYINTFYSKLFANFKLAALRGDLLKTLSIKEPIENQAKIKKITKIKKDLKLKPLIKNKQKEAAVKIQEEKVLIEQPVQKVKPHYYIQFGAFKKAIEAEKMIHLIHKKNRDLFDNLSKGIKTSNLGKKGIYHRLLAGPLTKQTATNLCTELNIRDTGGCFIVKY